MVKVWPGQHLPASLNNSKSVWDFCKLDQTVMCADKSNVNGLSTGIYLCIDRWQSTIKMAASCFDI